MAKNKERYVLLDPDHMGEPGKIYDEFQDAFAEAAEFIVENTNFSTELSYSRGQIVMDGEVRFHIRKANVE